MLIEIQGVGFVNKGAELMLHSIVEMIRSKLPDAQLVMAPGSKGDYEKRARLALLQKISYTKFKLQWGNLGGMIPPSFRKKYGLVTDAEIDVVLDASGFRYSDDWGVGQTVRMASKLKSLKKRGKKFIMLPQALGPFTAPQIKEAFKYIALNADLIFARDDVSYQHITTLTGERPHIKKAPDFTNLLDGMLPEGLDVETNRFCIVPNYRMIDKTSENKSEAYLPFMIRCAEYLIQKDQKPFILLHEGGNDLMLAQQISDAVGGNLPITIEEQPRNIKGIIGACEGTIGSRFHGLVSALSQGVPSLATGWSHKYEMLFKDYGFDDGLLNVMMSEDEIKKKIDLLIDPKSKESIKATILANSQRLKKLSLQMWDDVLGVITG